MLQVFACSFLGNYEEPGAGGEDGLRGVPGVGYVRRIPQPWGAASSSLGKRDGGTAWKLCAEMKRRVRHARPRIFWLCPDLGDPPPRAPVAEDFQLAPGIFHTRYLHCRRLGSPGLAGLTQSPFPSEVTGLSTGLSRDQLGGHVAFVNHLPPAGARKQDWSGGFPTTARLNLSKTTGFWKTLAGGTRRPPHATPGARGAWRVHGLTRSRADFPRA